MSVKALQEYTRYAKYARYNKDKGRRETWEEQVNRVFDMHEKHLGERLESIKDDFYFAKDMMMKKKILGSQRALQFGGDPTLRNNSKIYNCSASYLDRVKAFQEVEYLLLCGCGVGMSVQKHHIDKLPTIKKRENGKKIHVIEDSIEGWADAIGVLVSSYFTKNIPFKDYKGYEVEFDYSLIRPEGAPISWGGIAPGPKGLKNTIEKITTIFETVLEDGRNKLKPIEAYDILMHESDSVLSGGIRRCISKGSKVLVKGHSYKNIEDVKIGDMVSTNDGWKPVTNIFEQGVQKTINIIHQDGNLRCTPNHRVAVLKDVNGKYEWKYAKDLTVDDTLFFVNNKDDTKYIHKLPDFTYIKPLHSTTCKDIVIPDLDVDIAWLLGEIHGDGYVHLTSKSGQVAVAVEGYNKDKAIKVRNILQRFGVNPAIQEPKENDNCYKIVVKSKQLATYFQSWLKTPKTNIHIPECIKKSDASIKMAYIQGVLDSDGSIGDRCQQVVTTVYECFVDELQAMLLSVGIISRKHKSSMGKDWLTKNPTWQQKYNLTLANTNDIIKFNEYTTNIGYKKFRVRKCQQKSNAFPIEFIHNIKNKPKYTYTIIGNNSKRTPYSTYSRVFGENKIKPVSIKYIVFDDIEVETYDIEVADNHNFICQNVLVHNSATIIIFSPDDQDMATAKTGDWFIKNPQRGRSNNSALLLRDSTTREQFSALMQSVKDFGEPGFVWADNTEILYNPCLTKDTWITTSNGPKQINDLIGTPFTAIVNGQPFKSTEHGFVKTGEREVYKITTDSNTIKATDNHKFIILNSDLSSDWQEVRNIKIGDKIAIYEHTSIQYVSVTDIEKYGVEDVYDCEIPEIHCFIANGFVSHNCCEIGLYAYDEYGNSGFEFCNLTTINAKKCKTEEDFYTACKASAILGTIQASYDKFPYLGEVTERIVRKEALLGCSITGIMDNPSIILNPDFQKNGAAIIKDVNKDIAKKIGINQAARTTTVKPEGSSSCLLGTSSGIHPSHARRYIRRVQANKNEFPAQYFKMFNERAVEESVWSANKTDIVLSFLCEVPDGARVKNSTSALDLLEFVKLTQQNWVESGTNKDLCAQPWLRHNVSNTISIINEWDAVEDYIYENRQWFAGISLLPASGDLDYPQAPFTTVLTHKEIIDKFGEGALFASGLIVDGLNAFDNNLWAACDCALGIGEQLKLPAEIEEPEMPHKNGYTDKQWAKKLAEHASALNEYYETKESNDIINKKIDWTRRFKQFACRYCDNDYRKCSHLLKYVHNWKLWLDLKREYVDVDWSQALEEEFRLQVNTLGASSCAGGKCEIV